jgi:hypothetical protein
VQRCVTRLILSVLLFAAVLQGHAPQSLARAPLGGCRTGLCVLAVPLTVGELIPADCNGDQACDLGDCSCEEGLDRSETCVEGRAAQCWR